MNNGTLLQIIFKNGSEQYVRYLDAVSAQASRERFAQVPNVKTARVLEGC